VEKLVETCSQPPEATGAEYAVEGRSHFGSLCKLLSMRVLNLLALPCEDCLDAFPAESASRLLHSFAARVLRKSIRLPVGSARCVVTAKYSPGWVTATTFKR
jgi:hypothetical protein